MVDRYVVSKSRMVRIPCDGPIDAEIEKAELVQSMKAAGLQPDVEIEFVKKPRTRALGNEGHKRSTKLRYK